MTDDEQGYEYKCETCSNRFEHKEDFDICAVTLIIMKEHGRPTENYYRCGGKLWEK